MSIFRVVVAGGTIAVLHEKEVVLLDASLATKRALPLATATRPLDIALSPDGEHVASCFESGVSLEGRAFSGEERWGRGSALAWAGDVLWALREPDGEVFVLDPQSMTVRARGGLEWGDEARITLVAHPEGHVYAVGTEGQNGAEAHALVTSGERVVDVPLPDLGASYAVASTPSGGRIASQVADGTLAVRDATTLAVIHTLASPPSFVLVGFVDETRAVLTDGSELRLFVVGVAPEAKSGSVNGALLARAPASAPALAHPEDRGTRLLARLLDAGEIELVRRADRRELADHLDDLFASRRMTAEAVANVLEEHDSVAELFADDETLAAMLAELGPSGP